MSDTIQKIADEMTARASKLARESGDGDHLLQVIGREVAETVNGWANRLKHLSAGASGGGDAAKPLGYVLESDLAQLDANDSGTIWPFPAEATDQISGKRCGSVPVYLTPASPATVQGECRHLAEYVDGVLTCTRCGLKWTTTPQPAAAQGWVMVPREPTREMLKEIQLGLGFDLSALHSRYAAMLAAAPQAQEAPAKGKRHVEMPESWRFHPSRYDYESLIRRLRECRGDDNTLADMMLIVRDIQRGNLSTPPAHGDGEVIERAARWMRLLRDATNQEHEIAMLDAILAALTTRPTPEAQEARDARRYRWLRDQNANTDSPDAWTITRCDFTDADDPARYWVGADLDAAIDAAMSLPAQGREGE